jgi:hypothetical protein
MQRGASTLLAGFGGLMLCISASSARAQDYSGLSTLTPGKVAAENGLWIEVPLERQFKSGKRIVVADIKGPATITMVHFAFPASHVDGKTKLLDRDLLLRMYWDGEETPSVDCPLVDFFCDPAGLREVVNTALVNKRRGWNAYFPMPFRKSGRIELVYEGPVAAGDELWRIMPCYSYVIYRTADQIAETEGYFHACWRQEGLLIGKNDYVAMEAKGRGKFVGWNVTVRTPQGHWMPVDMNEKWYIDGGKEPALELQGIEDSFGFSWGFPETENVFPMTGYWPFFKGAAAYRFFVNDAISFEKSLKLAIGYGEHEDPMFHEVFTKPGSELQLSSTCYWYQTEPHGALPKMPPAAERGPAPEDKFWPGKDPGVPTAEELRGRGVKMLMMAGRPEKEVVFAEPGYDIKALNGYAYAGWPVPVYYTRADYEVLKLELTVPKKAKGTVRLYVMDPDNFMGGRRESITVGGKPAGLVEAFQKGKWVEAEVGSAQTANGKVLIEIKNEREKANAVVSMVEWVEKGK